MLTTYMPPSDFTQTQQAMSFSSNILKSGAHTEPLLSRHSELKSQWTNNRKSMSQNLPHRKDSNKVSGPTGKW